MKALASILLFLSLPSFAQLGESLEKSEYGNWQVACAPIVIKTERGEKKVYLGKEGIIKKGLMGSKIFQEENETEIAGLTAEVTRISLIEEEVEYTSTIAGRFQTEKKVFGVKVHLNAKEVLGTKIEGCLAISVKELDDYLICHQSRSKAVEF